MDINNEAVVSVGDLEIRITSGYDKTLPDFVKNIAILVEKICKWIKCHVNLITGARLIETNSTLLFVSLIT